MFYILSSFLSVLEGFCATSSPVVTVGKIFLQRIRSKEASIILEDLFKLGPGRAGQHNAKVALKI